MERRAALCLSLLAASAPASAQVIEGGYASARIGTYHADHSSYSRGLDGELAFGLRGFRYAAFEVAYGGFRAEQNLPPADVTETVFRSAKVGYFSWTAKVFPPFPIVKMEPYAGAGWSWNRVDLQVKDPPSTDRKTSGSHDGPHAVFGGDVRLNENLAVGLELRRQWIDALFDLTGTSWRMTLTFLF